MNDPAALATLAGAYRLHPGRRPGVSGARPVLEGRLASLLRGVEAQRAPQLCAAVFTLCAQAHRRTAAAAIAAAAGEPVREEPVLLALETARDHLRAVALDWTMRAGVEPGLAWLRAARSAGLSLSLQQQPVDGGPPAPEARAQLRALAGWLEQGVLHESPRDWLERCRDPGSLRAWCEQEAGNSPPARCLAQWHAPAHRLAAGFEPLEVPSGDGAQRDAQLRELAAALAADPGFAQSPQWRGAPRENGPWTRRRDGDEAASVWDRLASRWRELVRLAAFDDAADPPLRSGALRTGAREAIAWCEMARGLLFHWVRLDTQGRVADYRVLAPTEWNFHPRGVLARALESLPDHDTAAAALLAAAFDPCVPCTVAAP